MFFDLPDPHPDLLVGGTDPRIRIRIRIGMVRTECHGSSTPDNHIIGKSQQLRAKQMYRKTGTGTGSKYKVPLDECNPVQSQIWNLLLSFLYHQVPIYPHAGKQPRYG